MACLTELKLWFVLLLWCLSLVDTYQGNLFYNMINRFEEILEIDVSQLEKIYYFSGFL